MLEHVRNSSAILGSVSAGGAVRKELPDCCLWHWCCDSVRVLRNKRGCLDVGSSLGTPLCPMQGIWLKKQDTAPLRSLGLLFSERFALQSRTFQSPAFFPSHLLACRILAAFPDGSDNGTELAGPRPWGFKGQPQHCGAEQSQEGGWKNFDFSRK